MRTTTHHGRGKGNRGYSAKHNDRNYDIEKADNIVKDKVQDNVYEHYYGDEALTFEEAELRFYNEKFGAQLEKTNANYIANGHPERCKTMEEWKALKRNAPEESIFQIGKMEEHADKETLAACYEEYEEFLLKWSKEHNDPFTVLNKALHADEAVPHIQTRRVWHYFDEKSGLLKIGQEKALAAAGIELPEPTKKESRYNNRKIVFDKMCRDKWMDICEAHGIEIDREPVPDAKHNMSKEEMIRDKYEKLLEENKTLKKANVELSEHNQELSKINKEQQAVLDAALNTTSKIYDIEKIEEKTKKSMGGQVKLNEEDFNKLTEVAAKDWALENKNSKLEDENRKLNEKNKDLDKNNSRLVQKNKELQEQVKTYEEERVKFFFVTIVVKRIKEEVDRDEQMRRELQERLKKEWALFFRLRALEAEAWMKMQEAERIAAELRFIYNNSPKIFQCLLYAFVLGAEREAERAYDSYLAIESCFENQKEHINEIKNKKDLVADFGREMVFAIDTATGKAGLIYKSEMTENHKLAGVSKDIYEPERG